jgi:hypothetical protein
VELRKPDPDRHARERFTTLVLELKKLVTKSVNRFVGCGVSPTDLELIAGFLLAVGAKIPDNPGTSAEQRKLQNAKLEEMQA